MTADIVEYCCHIFRHSIISTRDEGISFHHGLRFHFFLVLFLLILKCLLPIAVPVSCFFAGVGAAFSGERDLLLIPHNGSVNH